MYFKKNQNDKTFENKQLKKIRRSLSATHFLKILLTKDLSKFLFWICFENEFLFKNISTEFWHQNKNDKLRKKLFFK